MTELKEKENIFESADYKRSRGMYMAQCTVEYFVGILIADAFLAKLLTHIGISDAIIGIISSFITLAFLFQLLAIFFVRRVTNTKKSVIIFHCLSQLFCIGLYIIPFLPFSTNVKTILIILGIMLSYVANYLIASILYKWGNSFVEPTKRGQYSASKEMLSLLTGIVFTLIVGYIIDHFEAIGNIEGGFLFIAASLLILGIVNFITLMGIKNEPKKEKQEQNIPLRVVAKNTLGNRNFLNIVVMMLLWDSARYMLTGFLGTYKTKDLLLTVGAVQVINMVANLFRFFASKPFGKYSDKHSFASGIKLAFILAAIAFGVNMFTTPKTWWLIVVFQILFNVSMAGSNQNLFNITYSYVKAEHFVAASAIKNSIGGIFGFASTLVASKILDYVQSNGNMLFGIPVYGQQVLSAIAFVLTVITVLFIHFVIEKQKVMVQ